VHEANITSGAGTFQKHVLNIEREIKTLLAFYEVEKDSLNKCEINAFKDRVIELLLSYMREIHRYTNQRSFSMALVKVIGLKILRKLLDVKTKT
jgi:hypothetical protein